MTDTTTDIHAVIPFTASRPYMDQRIVHADGPAWSIQTAQGLVHIAMHVALEATASISHRDAGPVVRDHSTQVSLNLPDLEPGCAGEMMIPTSEAAAVGRALIEAAGMARYLTRTARPDLNSPFIVTDRPADRDHP